MDQNTSQPGAKRKRDQRLLAGVAIVLILVAIGVAWRSVREQGRPIRAVTRSAGDFIVDWRCLACGHTLTDAGGPGPRTCPKCQKREMYVTIRWSCGAHGVQQVIFQYDQQGDPIQVRIGNRDWAPYLDAEGGFNVRCPVCNAVMAPAEAPRSRE